MVRDKKKGGDEAGGSRKARCRKIVRENGDGRSRREATHGRSLVFFVRAKEMIGQGRKGDFFQFFLVFSVLLLAVGSSQRMEG